MVSGNHYTRGRNIYIFSPKIFEKVSSHPATNFDPILTHELAHVFTNEVIKTNRPVWLNEGLAGYVAGQCKKKQLKKVDDFRNLHSRKDWNKTPNYTQSCIFTTFLIEKFGKNKLLQFLKTFPENDGTRESFSEFSKFFSTFFNADFNDIVQEWKKEMLPRKESE